MQIVITEPLRDTLLRRLRVATIRAVSLVLRVPISISDEFYGASPGQVSS